MVGKIKVSVIIPCYNQEDLVFKCLMSIPRRTDVEIIVVNDGSTDRSLETIMSYKDKINDKLVVINFEKNKGVSCARNAGIEASNGEYLVFIDSDDWVDAFYFEKIMKEYLDGSDMCFYNMITNDKTIYYVDSTNYLERKGMFRFVKKEFVGDTRFHIGNSYGEDGEFQRALLSKKPSVYFSNYIMYHYNYPREGSLSYIGRTKNQKIDNS